MLPFFFFFVRAFLCSVIPLFFPLLNFCLPSILLSSVPSVLPSHHMECCVILAFFLSQNKINLPTPHFSLPPSLPPSPVFLWSSSSAETTGELLLKSTDRSTVKRNKRKDRFFLLKPQKLKREKKTAACHRTVGGHFLTINNTARSGGRRREEGGTGKAVRESGAANASTVPRLMSIAICLLLFHSFFVCPALPLSVSFSLSCWS